MKLQVILGSTRAGRVSPKVANWAVKHAETTGVFDEVELVDLIDYPLSFMDEPISPQYNPERKPSAETQAWLDKIAEADAYLIVSPEYNRALPAVLKNAFDHVAYEMSDKPVSAITHGSTGGAQAYATLKLILPGLNAIVMPKSVYLQFAQLGDFAEDGTFNGDQESPWSPVKSLDATVDQLAKYAQALKPLRS